ncbi:hypothetical protein APR41_06685 [Salegentibacter salinarum]|uniref:Lipoprotein n=1 Tax=Salegentibacter salinarum TaxID=447422 RepID=A0A2N0TQV3_9FLAO|nr:hypothetical protein [Salegentibacter salinarum]PKD17115.1 hypothetical protein APR41_06685 [Salegentibacter salinarum]SKB55118.1 hypothetical protein SAMN05660903_01362 [Salegentibacter salinarum]
MKNSKIFYRLFFALLLAFSLSACSNDDDVDEGDDVTDDLTDDINGSDDDDGNGDGDGEPDPDAAAVFVFIDEESIDNGNEPNDFSETDVNDDISEIGQREVLAYFNENPGEEITLYTGQTGDEAWFVLKEIPGSWNEAGPNENGARNFLEAGPGLGQDQTEDLLDEISDITPLRATGLSMLTGQTIIAVVYDSDISINYDPLEGNLQGENLGVVAFEVLNVTERTDGSSSALPSVNIRILDYTAVEALELNLFSNAPMPESSSEPEDTTPPDTIPDIELSPAE